MSWPNWLNTVPKFGFPMLSCCVAPVVDDVQTEVEVVTGTGLDTDQKELEDAFDAFENTEQPTLLRQDRSLQDLKAVNLPADKAPPKIQPVDPVDSKHWQVIFKDEETNVRMEYLPSKYIPGGATYRARAVMEMPLSVEDALMCFMDFSKKKLNYARDYKDISVDKVLKHTGQLPGNLPEESIVTVTLNFSGFLWIVKPFFPASITLHLSVEEDVNCPGQYHWMQESLGPDGRPDGRTKKGGSIEAHPSGEKGKCMLASLSEVPSWFPVWVMKYSAPKIKTYLSEYTGRYLEYKKTLQ